MINVPIIDDKLFEGNESFLVQLSVDSPHRNLKLENSTREIILIDNGELDHQVCCWMFKSPCKVTVQQTIKELNGHLSSFLWSGLCTFLSCLDKGRSNGSLRGDQRIPPQWIQRSFHSFHWTPFLASLAILLPIPFLHSCSYCMQPVNQSVWYVCANNSGNPLSEFLNLPLLYPPFPKLSILPTPCVS